MFKGLKVTRFDNKTVVSLSPFIDMTFIFKYHNGLIKVDRIASGILEENVYDVCLPVVSLSNTNDFYWLKKALPASRLEIIKQIEFKQIPLFNAINGSKEFSELFETAPVLAWLMTCFLDSDFSAHILNYFSLCKRRNLLTKITNFECDEKHVKFVSKVELVFGLEAEALLILKFIPNEEVINSYKHRLSIKSSELYLIDKYPFLISSNLLPKLVAKKRKNLGEFTIGIGNLLKTYQDTIELGLALDFKDSKSIVSACDSEAQLFQLHSQWIALVNKSNTYLNPDIHFDPFPYLNCSKFEYLSSINALIKEGQTMEHCVATYKDKALKKESFLFKVYSPERATLEVGFGGNEYFLKQLKLIRNKEASSETYEEVYNWLKTINSDLKGDLEKIS
jgi:hypothetical protein